MNKIIRITASLFTITLLMQTSGCQPETRSKPNIIFIIADDLNDAVGTYGGHPQSMTPNLDRLAADGVTFLNAHANVPLCGPSRISMLKGIDPHHSGYYGQNFIDDHWKNWPNLVDRPDFVEFFQKSGYKTLGTGKSYHNNQEDWGHWDEFGHLPDWGPWAWDGDDEISMEHDEPSPWRTHVTHPGAAYKGAGHDAEFGSLDNVPDVPAKDEMPGYKGWRCFFKPFKYNSRDDRDLMPDELNAQWAGTKLKEDHDKPFLMFIGINKPHTPMFAPQENFDNFPLEDLQLANIKDDDLDDISSMLMKDWGTMKYDGLIKSGKLKEWTQAYLANVNFADAQIGKIMASLADSKYADNTYIIITSDHGYHMGEKKRTHKNTLWEESSKVPFIVYGPDVIAGKRTRTPISLVDVFPTLVDLAGLETTTQQAIDGNSLRPLIENEADKWDGEEFALVAVRGPDKIEWSIPAPADRQFWALRTERYRYILCPNGEEELYDHDNDENEWTNLASDPKHASIKAELNAKLLKALAE